MVRGGVRGEGAGIAHGTIPQSVCTIKAFPLFLEGYHQVGGITTGIFVGKDVSGTTNGYLTENLNGTGAFGKGVCIGRSKNLGLFKEGRPTGRLLSTWGSPYGAGKRKGIKGQRHPHAYQWGLLNLE